ncbi:NAD(P)-dependent oxidoreductase [Streptomonospora salina]|uniref:3-hydroxyisobutyrate dehydrogenase-like beta-hydroxyacid dehydrogenase n=1 Tax=Streptomonospora salina TaxID=104205 RepID=A0A841E8Z2_9ACTN|nr:NAD(P)-binding domain-containing protein [Streptomonospora salina]MBB5997578.1 3-hydroxyisobutyrate dehydrogenase-like beta-hydroxyacid dehydrogenase [Streptomonospora salina]
MTNSPSPHTQSPAVSVIGLGPMGSALARGFLAGGVPTTVWNRTRAKAEALAPEGADVAADPASAARAAHTVVTCLRDHAATRELLASLPDGALSGRTVVVLASSTPNEARATRAWADAQGVDLLIGAIMVPTPLIGTGNALILYSGGRDLLDRSRPVLETVAPRSEYVGDDPGSAALLDTGMLDVFFAGMTGFLHASAMAAAQGSSAAVFAPWAKEMLAILPATFDGLAADVDAGHHPGHRDNLAMEEAALGHIVHTSRESGLDSRLPELMHGLARTAVERGHGADGWSRVVDVLRAAPERESAQGG